MTLSLNKNRISVALVCLLGAALLGGCSEPPKTEATPPASTTSTASGAGPQRQALGNNGPSAAPGAANGTLRRIGNK